MDSCFTRNPTGLPDENGEEIAIVLKRFLVTLSLPEADKKITKSDRCQILAILIMKQVLMKEALPQRKNKTIGTV